MAFGLACVTACRFFPPCELGAERRRADVFLRRTGWLQPSPSLWCLQNFVQLMNAARSNNLSEKQTRHRPSAFGRRSLGTGRVAARPDNLPPWQLERMAVLHRACERVKERRARGERLLRSIGKVARSLNRQPFKSDPARKLKLSPNTLLRWYYAWCANGESKAAFRLKFTACHSLFKSLVIAKFADFLMAHPRRSFRVNWNIFSSRPGNFHGRWRPAKRAVKAAMKKAAEIKARVRGASN